MTVLAEHHEVPSLSAKGSAKHADPAFGWVLMLCALSTLVILALMIGSTLIDAAPVFRHMGVDFFIDSRWAPGSDRHHITGDYGAWTFIFGTLYTSMIAIVIAVPLAVGIALFLTEVLPPRIARPIQYAVEALAAVPSVIYGLWGVYFFSPQVLVPIERRLTDTIGAVIPFFNPGEGRQVITFSYFTAGNVLAIMILPIISSVVREVFAQVPAGERQAAYGLGATRWEVMWHVVLHRGRPGIIGATMLGLGRALGETIAVLLLIGSTIQASTRIFDQGQSMAGIIATQYKEASPEHVKALMAVGVALFGIAILVNMAARFVVSRFAHLDDSAV